METSMQLLMQANLYAHLERSMHNYSSAKLELLVPKQAVTEKFWDYLLGSWFQVYMDNNPLAYIQESKLGASQIQ